MAKSPEELLAEADDMRRAANKLVERADALRKRAFAETPLAGRLIYAAHARCPCGAGLAYDSAGLVGGDDGPHHKPNAWDCSAILLGEAVQSGLPGAVRHTAPLPFAFFEIKSEHQRSVKGTTTRPAPRWALNGGGNQ